MSHHEGRSAGIFQEEGGLVVMEIESVPLPGVFSKRESFYRGIFDEWVRDTSIPGYLGDCYYRWGGADLKWNPGSGILSYRFDIKTPGRYLISVRNRHDNEDKSESNDGFMRVDGGQWWKFKSRVHRQWTWDTWYEKGHDPLINEECWHVFEAGLHTVEICGRSNNFCLDRIAVAREGVDGRRDDLPVSARV